MEQGGTEDALTRDYGDFEEQISRKVSMGTHACLIYDLPEDQLSALALLIKEGLRAGERCVCAQQERTEAEVAEALARLGVDPAAQLGRGALRFITPESVFLRGAEFDAAYSVGRLREMNQEGRAQGFKGLRFFGEASWVYRRGARWNELLEFEVLLEELLRQGEVCVICQLNTRRLPADEVAAWLRGHPSAIAGGQVHEVNPFYVPPNLALPGASPAKKLNWMRSRLTRVREAENRLAKLAEQHRQAEERVRVAEKRLNLAVEIAGLGMWSHYFPKDQTSVDARVRALTGISLPNPFPVRHFYSTVHPDDLPKLVKAVGFAMKPESGGVYRVEFRARPREGQQTPPWRETRGQVFFDAQQKPLRLVGTLLDISARKEREAERARLLAREREAREAAEASERRYRFLAESMPQIVFTADPQGALTYVNRAFADYRGLPADDHQAWQEIATCASVHPADREAAIAAWRHSIETETPFQHEHRLLRADGVYRWFLGRARPMRDPEGRVQAWFGTQTDIDDLKHTEAELKEAVRAREEFLSIASHELRTPLTPLRLQLDHLGRVIRQSGVQDRRLDDKLEQTTRQVQRLKKLVENLLDVSRLQAGRLTLERERFDLGELVEDAASRACEDAHVKPSSVRLHRGEPVCGRWDRTRLEQVVSNLISNAIKYGRGRPIDVDVEANDGVARVTVRDQGIGISREDLERIFGRFERAVSIRHFGGLGLGLFIAKQIVEAHGGSLIARSVLGEGSTFTVVVPLEPLVENAPQPQL